MVKTVSGMSGTILGAVFALVMLLLFWMNLGALKRKTEEGVYDLGACRQEVFGQRQRRSLANIIGAGLEGQPPHGNAFAS